MTIKPFENDLHAMIQVFQKSPARNAVVIAPEGLNTFDATIRLAALCENVGLMGDNLVINNRTLTVKREKQFHPIGLTQGDVYLFDISHYEKAEELLRKIPKFTQSTGAMCIFASHKNEQ